MVSDVDAALGPFALSVSDWVNTGVNAVAALGTAGALGVSLHILFDERKVRLREQASKVAAWTEWEQTRLRDKTSRRFFAYVKNSSDDPIYGRAGNAEQVGEFSGAVLPALKQCHQMCFLSAVELWLLATQTTFGLGDLHALLGAQPNQVRLDYVDKAGSASTSWPTNPRRASPLMTMTGRRDRNVGNQQSARAA
jgi:hypothetical protein